MRLAAIRNTPVDRPMIGSDGWWLPRWVDCHAAFFGRQIELLAEFHAFGLFTQAESPDIPRAERLKQNGRDTAGFGPV